MHTLLVAALVALEASRLLVQLTFETERDEKRRDEMWKCSTNDRFQSSGPDAFGFGPIQENSRDSSGHVCRVRHRTARTRIPVDRRTSSLRTQVILLYCRLMQSMCAAVYCTVL